MPTFWQGRGRVTAGRAKLGTGILVMPSAVNAGRHLSEQLSSTTCSLAACSHLPLTLHCRYKIEQELGTEIKPIPPQIEERLYCS